MTDHRRQRVVRRLAMPDSAFCQRHPDTPTNLRCGRCETRICPDCMVYAPVGARCPDCATVAPLPMFEVGTAELAKALAISISVGIAGGTVMGFLAPIFYGLLGVVALAGIGYSIGELVSASVNRKRGKTLQYVAVGGVAMAFLTSLFVSVAITGYPLSAIWALIGAGLGGYLAVARFRI